MEKNDIFIKLERGDFVFRVGAFIRKDNKVLMAKNDRQSHYYSVGGKVKWGETSEEAIVREVFEETGIKMEVERLVFVHENFFEEDGMPRHEISFFYLMKECNLDDLIISSITSEGIRETLYWLSERELEQYEIYPVFIRTDLNQMTEGVKHYITKDDVLI